VDEVGPKQRSHRRGRRLTASLCAVLALFPGCGDQTSTGDLQALRKDAMASATFPGTEVVSESPSEADTAMGEPRYASFEKKLRVTDGREPVDVVAAVVAQAQDRGWEWSGTAQLPESKLLTKAIGGKRGDLKVFTAIDDPSLVILNISLH
jgi:hypothetical protein